MQIVDQKMELIQKSQNKVAKPQQNVEIQPLHFITSVENIFLVSLCSIQ